MLLIYVHKLCKQLIKLKLITSVIGFGYWTHARFKKKKLQTKFSSNGNIINSKQRY